MAAAMSVTARPAWTCSHSTKGVAAVFMGISLGAGRARQFAPRVWALFALYLLELLDHLHKWFNNAKRGDSPAIDVAEAIFTCQFAHMERLSAFKIGRASCRERV